MYTLKKKGFVSALPASGKILWGKKNKTRAVMKVPVLVTACLEDWRSSCNKEINHVIVEPG